MTAGRGAIDRSCSPNTSPRVATSALGLRDIDCLSITSAQDEGFKIALQEAKASAAEGGIPVGSAVVSAAGKVLGRGRNMRIQNGSPILHVGSLTSPS